MEILDFWAFWRFLGPSFVLRDFGIFWCLDYRGNPKSGPRKNGKTPSRMAKLGPEIKIGPAQLSYYCAGENFLGKVLGFCIFAIFFVREIFGPKISIVEKTRFS